MEWSRVSLLVRIWSSNIISCSSAWLLNAFDEVSTAIGLCSVINFVRRFLLQPNGIFLFEIMFESIALSFKMLLLSEFKIVVLCENPDCSRNSRTLRVCGGDRNDCGPYFLWVYSMLETISLIDLFIFASRTSGDAFKYC